MRRECASKVPTCAGASAVNSATSKTCGHSDAHLCRSAAQPTQRHTGSAYLRLPMRRALAAALALSAAALLAAPQAAAQDDSYGAAVAEALRSFGIGGACTAKLSGTRLEAKVCKASAAHRRITPAATRLCATRADV